MKRFKHVVSYNTPHSSRGYVNPKARLRLEVRMVPKSAVGGLLVCFAQLPILYFTQENENDPIKPSTLGSLSIRRGL